MTSKYSQYTSKGASLAAAQSAHGQWANNNKQSFFNLNNAMGMVKILLIIGVIVIVVIVMSPLFDLLKNLVGAGNTVLTMFTDLIKNCEDIGICKPSGSDTTPDPGTIGQCDDTAGAQYKGQSCKTPASPDDNPCGSKWDNWCTVLFIGWWAMTPFCALVGWFGKWMLRDKGKISDSITAAVDAGYDSILKDIWTEVATNDADKNIESLDDAINHARDYVAEKANDNNKAWAETWVDAGLLKPSSDGKSYEATSSGEWDKIYKEGGRGLPKMMGGKGMVKWISDFRTWINGYKTINRKSKVGDSVYDSVKKAWELELKKATAVGAENKIKTANDELAAIERARQEHDRDTQNENDGNDGHVPDPVEGK